MPTVQGEVLRALQGQEVLSLSRCLQSSLAGLGLLGIDLDRGWVSWGVQELLWSSKVQLKQLQMG